jgi:two-component system chemotaxis response regulator CheY
MVIDDSRAIRMILAGILTELGYQVEHAVNGKDALSNVARDPDISLFLVDWNMPEMNGLEFVQAIRRDQRFRDTPLMMVTTETEISQISKALDAGANEYVMKPFTKDMIQEKLQMIGAVQ